MNRVVFLDPVCPTPYDDRTLASEPMGGTEANVVRTAENLAKEGLQVYVLQHIRKSDYISPGGVTYGTAEVLNSIEPNHVVTLRDVMPMAYIYHKFPKAKQYLWLHDLMTPNDNFHKATDLLKQIKPVVITVSKSHQNQVKGILLGMYKDIHEYITLQTIYPPIPDDLGPPTEQRDPNKLLFMSSPHKGLQQTLAIFSFIRGYYPELKLYVSNPGYLPSIENVPENVIVLGKLNHTQVLEELKSSMCLFYPNTNWATRETFGLVFAEAAATGTPTIVHDMGSSREILGDDGVLDCRNPKWVLGRLEHCQNLVKSSNGAKLLETTNGLRQNAVTGKWLTLLKSRR